MLFAHFRANIHRAASSVVVVKEQGFATLLLRDDEANDSGEKDPETLHCVT